MKVADTAVKQVLYSQSVKKAPGPENLSFEAICLLWKWAKERILGLSTATIRTGQHQSVSKQRNGVTIYKPGMFNYMKLT